MSYMTDSANFGPTGDPSDLLRFKNLLDSFGIEYDYADMAKVFSNDNGDKVFYLDTHHKNVGGTIGHTTAIYFDQEEDFKHIFLFKALGHNCLDGVEIDPENKEIVKLKDKISKKHLKEAIQSDFLRGRSSEHHLKSLDSADKAIIQRVFEIIDKL